MINPMQRSGPMRMMGMASGMDTDFIIQQSLRMHQFKIDNKIRQRTLIEWRQQTHNSIRDQLRDFSSSFLSMTSQRSMFASNNYNTNRATLTGANSAAVSITTRANSALGNFSILSATRASGSNATSVGRVSANQAGFTMSTQLKDMNFHTGAFTFSNTEYLNSSGEKITIASYAPPKNGIEVTGEVFTATNTVTGETFDVIRTDDGIRRVELNNKTALAFHDDVTNIQTDSGETIKITNNGGNFSYQILDSDGDPIGSSVIINPGDLTISVAGNDIRLNLAGDNLSFVQDIAYGESAWRAATNVSINGTDIALHSNMTMTQMINSVNNSAANVTMSYDQLNDRFTLSSKDIGTGGGGLSSNGLEMMRFSGVNPATNSSVTILTTAGDRVTVDGGTSNSVNFGGVTININQTFAETAQNEIRVNITRDVDTAFNNIKNFIDSYNTIIRRIEGLLSERKGPNEASYKPLTDEEKSAMTEKQIEEWEAIAKKGILRNDSALQNLARDLRNSFFNTIEGTGMRPSDLGLSTGNFFDRTGGQIFIDEERLRRALEDDPDRVMEVFTRNFAGATLAEQGLVARINTTINNFISTRGPQNNTLRSLEASIKSVNDQIERMTARMWAEEDKLYRQFAAMEKAMSSLQSQGDWFAAMLGNL